MPVVVRPAEGVYTYRTDGHEGFEGIFDREFPPISHRTIIHTGPATWSDHTIFSEERKSWSRFEFSQGQRRVPSQRNRIKFAAYVEDRTVTFDPPLLSTTYPWKLGRTWRGTFSGETYGSFEAKTAHRENVNVGSERFPAWGDSSTSSYTATSRARFRSRGGSHPSTVSHSVRSTARTRGSDRSITSRSGRSRSDPWNPPAEPLGVLVEPVGPLHLPVEPRAVFELIRSRGRASRRPPSARVARGSGSGSN